MAEGATAVRFTIGGMGCDGCAATIRSEVSKIEGVQKADVSYEQGAAEILIDSENEEQIIARIVEEVEEEGFTIARAEGG